MNQKSNAKRSLPCIWNGTIVTADKGVNDGERYKLKNIQIIAGQCYYCANFHNINVTITVRHMEITYGAMNANHMLISECYIVLWCIYYNVPYILSPITQIKWNYNGNVNRKYVMVCVEYLMTMDGDAFPETFQTYIAVNYFLNRVAFNWYKWENYNYWNDWVISYIMCFCFT